MSAARLARIRSQITSLSDVWLLLRMAGWALVLPVAKHLVPMHSLARMMHVTAASGAHQDTNSPTRQSHERAERVVTLARWAARLVRPRSGGNCLERGLIAYRYLCLLGASPTLVVGLAPGIRGGMVGHAWVLLDGRPAGESEAAVQAYTRVFAFGPDGALLDAPRPGALPVAGRLP